MRRVGHLGVWWSGCFLMMGCGGSPATEDECTAFKPCGGQLEGTWQLDESCFLTDPLEQLELQPEVCEEYYQEVSYQISGTLSFEAQTFTPNLQQTRTLLVRITSDCRGTRIDEAECASIEGEFRASDRPTVANCSVAEGACHCRTTTTESLVEPETYALEGSKMRRLASGELSDYCVDKDRLKLTLYAGDHLLAVLSLTRTP